MTEEELDRLNETWSDPTRGDGKIILPLITSLREARAALAKAEAEKEAAVLAEREACAMLVEQGPLRVSEDGTALSLAYHYRSLASDIRSRTHSGETK